MTGRKTTVRRASVRRKSTRSPSATRTGTPRSFKSEPYCQENSFRASVEDLKDQTSPIAPANNSSERITRSSIQSHRKSFAEVASEQPRASLSASASEFVPVTLRSSRQSLNPPVRNSAAGVVAVTEAEAEATKVKTKSIQSIQSIQSIVNEPVQSQEVIESKTEVVEEVKPESNEAVIADENSNDQANNENSNEKENNENSNEEATTANEQENTNAEVPVEGEGQVASQKAARCRCTIS